MKEGRRKFKQEDAFDIGVKAKKVWEEVMCNCEGHELEKKNIFPLMSCK